MTCRANAMTTRNRIGRHESVAATDLLGPEQSESGQWTVLVTLEEDVDELATSLLVEIVRRNASVADVSPQGDRTVAEVRA